MIWSIVIYYYSPAACDLQIEVDDGYCEADLAIPAEVKRLMGSVQRDIGENVLHRAARLNYEVMTMYMVVFLLQ